MGLAMGAGGDLGAARGRIEIDTSQPERVPGIMRGVSQQTAQSMGAVDVAAKRNEQSLAAAREAVAAYAAQTTGSLASARAAVQALAATSTGYLPQAQAAVQNYATGATTTLTGLGPAASTAVQGITAVGTASAGAAPGISNLSNSLQQLAGAFGLSFGVAGVVQLGRMTVALANNQAQAERTRMQYDVLAQGVGEAGDEMLASMRTASRGMISDNELIIAANRAMLLEVAKTSDEMGEMLNASRVLGQAMGQDVGKSFNDLVIGLGRLSPLILDNLGIANEGEQMFENYARSIGRTADSLTKAEKQQLLLNKVMDAAAPLLAAEAERADNGADKTDRLATSWKNYTDQLGEFINKYGGVPVLTDATSSALEAQTGILATLVDWWNKYAAAVGGAGVAMEQRLREQGFNMGGTDLRDTTGGVPKWMTGVSPKASVPLLSDVSQEKRQIQLDWSEGIADLNARTNEQILEQGENYNRQRANAESDYQKGVSRDAEDFARNRLYAERKHNLAILDVYSDSARQRTKWEEGLARSIAKAQQDSAERMADAREDTNKRLAELDKDYRRDQEKAARDHTRNLREAAGRLDAKAIAEAQANYRDQQQDAKEAHDDQRTKLQEQLEERLSEESENLAKSIAQQREAHALQLTEQAENDRLRIDNMKAAFEAQKAQEDVERGVRLTRQATDHAANMVEMERQHAADIAQIERHKVAERAQLDAEAIAELSRLEGANAAIVAVQKAREDALLASWDRVWAHMKNSLVLGPNSPVLGPSNRLPIPSMSNGLQSGGSIGPSGVRVGQVAINIYPNGSQSAYDIGAEVRTQFTLLLQELNR